MINARQTIFGNERAFLSGYKTEIGQLTYERTQVHSTRLDTVQRVCDALAAAGLKELQHPAIQLKNEGIEKLELLSWYPIKIVLYTLW